VVAELLPIRTERLTLRPFAQSDARAMLRIYGDPEVMRYVGTGAVADLLDAHAMLGEYIRHQRRHGFSFWAVCESDRGEPIGDAGLYRSRRRPREIELGYTLAREVWGRGYATEAGSACVAAARLLGLRRVVAITDPLNVASQHVLEKLGLHAAGRRMAYGREHLLYRLDQGRASKLSGPVV
jgi:[ribosomal protein S5]-alanine N-acetyltransferase